MNAGCWELIPTIARATEGDTATEPAYEDEWGGGEIDVRAQARFGSLGEVESFEGNIWHDGSSSRVQGTVEYDWR